MAIKFNKSKFQVNLSKSVSDEAKFFLEPNNPKQRQYEALRAFFIENTPVETIAERFGYTSGAFHALCHKFRNRLELFCRGYSIIFERRLLLH